MQAGLHALGAQRIAMQPLATHALPAGCGLEGQQVVIQRQLVDLAGASRAVIADGIDNRLPARDAPAPALGRQATRLAGLVQQAEVDRTDIGACGRRLQRALLVFQRYRFDHQHGLLLTETDHLARHHGHAHALLQAWHRNGIGLRQPLGRAGRQHGRWQACRRQFRQRHGGAPAHLFLLDQLLVIAEGGIHQGARVQAVGNAQVLHRLGILRRPLAAGQGQQQRQAGHPPDTPRTHAPGSAGGALRGCMAPATRSKRNRRHSIGPFHIGILRDSRRRMRRGRSRSGVSSQAVQPG